jgi:ABC-type tungstate transport system substrate-binding protein
MVKMNAPFILFKLIYTTYYQILGQLRFLLLPVIII